MQRLESLNKINPLKTHQFYLANSKLWKMIQEAGDYLVGQLPEHPNHPKGRNPYAHVAICVKDHFDASYKDIPDEKFDEVVKYIEFLKQNPS